MGETEWPGRVRLEEVVDLHKIQTVIAAEARMASDLLDQLPEAG